MHLAVIRIDELFLAIEVGSVREVWSTQSALKVPLASELVVGLVNRRGVVVSMIDGRRVLGLPPTDPSEGSRDHQMVILEENKELLGLKVCELVETLEVDSDGFLPVASSLPAGVRRLAVALHPEGERVIIVLCAKTIFQLARGEDGPIEEKRA